MANRKSDTDRRLNKYFALSQLRKRGREGEGRRPAGVADRRGHCTAPHSRQPPVEPSLKSGLPQTVSLVGCVPSG